MTPAKFRGGDGAFFVDIKTAAMEDIAEGEIGVTHKVAVGAG